MLSVFLQVSTPWVCQPAISARGTCKATLIKTQVTRCTPWSVFRVNICSPAKPMRMRRLYYLSTEPIPYSCPAAAARRPEPPPTSSIVVISGNKAKQLSGPPPPPPDFATAPPLLSPSLLLLLLLLLADNGRAVQMLAAAAVGRRVGGRARRRTTLSLLLRSFVRPFGLRGQRLWSRSQIM